MSTCDLSDNRDTRLRRGRSCSKYVNSAEIHSAEAEAMEETGFGSPPIPGKRSYPHAVGYLKRKKMGALPFLPSLGGEGSVQGCPAKPHGNTLLVQLDEAEVLPRCLRLWHQ